MNERAIRYEEPSEVDLERLLVAVLNKSWLVILTALLSAVIAFAGTKYFVTPLYRSSAMFYVNNRNISVDGVISAFTSEEIRVARYMVDTYVVILNTRATLEEVINRADISGDADAVRKMLEVEMPEMIDTEIVNETEIFRVRVTSPDPNDAERIANAIAVVLPQRIADVIDGTSARVVDTAVVPSSPFSPDTRNSLILGGFFGTVLAAGIIVLRELYNNKIRSERDLARFEGIPLLGSIPDLKNEGKKSRYARSTYR